MCIYVYIDTDTCMCMHVVHTCNMYMHVMCVCMLYYVTHVCNVTCAYVHHVCTCIQMYVHVCVYGMYYACIYITTKMGESQQVCHTHTYTERTLAQHRAAMATIIPRM